VAVEVADARYLEADAGRQAEIVPGGAAVVHLPPAGTAGRIVAPEDVRGAFPVEIVRRRDQPGWNGLIIEGKLLDAGERVGAVRAGDLQRGAVEARQRVGRAQTGEHRRVDARATVEGVVAEAAL